MDPVENIKPVIELAQKFGTLQAQQPIERTINDVPCLVGSFNGNVAPLVLPERLLPHPKRKRAKVELYEERSFIDYLNRHSRPGKTHVFGEADEAGGKFTAIIDYHQEERDPLAEASEQPEPKAPVIPGWGEHTVSFTLEVTRDGDGKFCLSIHGRTTRGKPIIVKITLGWWILPYVIRGIREAWAKERESRLREIHEVNGVLPEPPPPF